jgi:hypothetical protein
VFLIIGLLHLYRAVMGYPAVIGGFSVPLWASLIVIAVAGCLTYSAYQLQVQECARKK